VTEQKIYFQWQNEVLEKTIYPLRQMKLRHVLEYYMEIELWAQYKDQRLAEQSPEIVEYHARKKAVIVKAVRDYDDLLAYWMRDYSQLVDAARPVDERTLEKVKAFHTAFKTYFPALKDARKESYFISQRFEELDRVRLQLDKDISLQARRVNVIKTINRNHPGIPAEIKKLELLQNASPILEAERVKLRELISAHEKLAKRKLEYAAKVGAAVKKQKEIGIRLDPIKKRIEFQELKLKEVQDDLHRRRTQPDRASAEKYFSSPDVTGEILSRFPQVDQVILKTANEVHRLLAAFKGNDVKLANLAGQTFKLQLEKTRFERRTGLDATFKENTLRAFDDELNRMKDFRSVLEQSNKSAEALSQDIKAREADESRIQGPLESLRKEAALLQSQLDELDDILFVTEEKYISEYTPVQPTLKEIVRLKLDEYTATLTDKNQYQLLEMIVERFKREPQRYPRWLQYMIIHFSGMRYASAHGSWADPKDLYLNLRTSKVEADLKGMDDYAIAAICNQKLAWYEPAQGVVLPGAQAEPPKLAKVQDAKWKEKVAPQLARIRSDNAYSRRIGLFNLMLDEENYEVETMTAEDALAGLERIKDTLPEWMWKEISAVTDLRLKEAKDATWEKLTPEQQQARSSAEWQKYREIMNKWKQDNLTGWRQEHERNIDLVVSRAVCNEVAEFVQHLRGHKGGAGLASKPDWYRGEEIKYNASPNKKPDDDKPFFMKPRKVEDYHVGASILWVRYRNDPPNPWDEVKDSTTSGGDRLVPNEYLMGKPGRQWVYKGGGTVRTNSVTKKSQYLYWLHEATVAEVAETAEGKVVLTFETALPYEDRRLSSVGLFKHYDYNILFDGGEEAYNGSFEGYVPENKVGIPTKDLDDMLNWDHVLLKV